LVCYAYGVDIKQGLNAGRNAGKCEDGREEDKVEEDFARGGGGGGLEWVPRGASMVSES
jgi:hypothetical protein